MIAFIPAGKLSSKKLLVKNKFHFVRILPLKVLGIIEENLKFFSFKSRIHLWVITPLEPLV